MSDDATGAQELREVRLLGLPVEIHRRASEHAQGLQREFDLIRRRDPDPEEVPSRMFVLIDQLNADYGGLNLGADEALQEAMARHDEVIDLEYRVPVEAADACRQLGDLLDEADEYCRRGVGLLSLATPPESLAYRRWFLDEFIHQLAGAPPTPWPGFSDDGPADDLRTAPGSAAPDGGALEPSDAASAVGPWSLSGTNRAPVLVVSGELDLATSRGLRDVLVDLQAAGAEALTIDLTSVRFIDSVGVSVLVTAHLRLIDSGAVLVLIVSSAVHRVLEVAGLSDVLTLRRADDA